MIVGQRVLSEVQVALLQAQDVERIEPVRAEVPWGPAPSNASHSSSLRPR